MTSPASTTRTTAWTAAQAPTRAWRGCASITATSGRISLRYYLDNFEDSLTGVVPGARVLVNDLKAAGIGVWGLSNWEKELFPIALKHCEILQRLDGRLVSGYVHMRKPHKDIYEKALEEFGISAESSVFIDDKAMNIAGANEAGIRGIRFSDARKLRELLIEQGIDIPAVQ